MNDGLQTTQISFRLANGEYFPLFRYSGSDSQRLTLVPAREGQESADIEFFHHPADGSQPKSLGVLRFPDMPSGKNAELKLIADIGTAGLLTVRISHEASGRVETLEAEFNPDQPPAVQSPAPSGLRIRGPLRWLLGMLFVLSILVLVALSTYAFAQWGKQEPVPPPFSKMISTDGRA